MRVQKIQSTTIAQLSTQSAEEPTLGMVSIFSLVGGQRSVMKVREETHACEVFCDLFLVDSSQRNFERKRGRNR